MKLHEIEATSINSLIFIISDAKLLKNIPTIYLILPLDGQTIAIKFHSEFIFE